MMALASLEHRLTSIAEDLGAPSPMEVQRVKRALVDARLEAGARLMRSPERAPSFGLDECSARRAAALRARIAHAVLGDVERALLEVCICAIAGGVSPHSLARCRHIDSTLLEGAFDVLAAYMPLHDAHDDRPFTPHFGDEPPVRVRTLAELSLFAIESARVVCPALDDPRARVLALLAEGHLAEVRGWLDPILTTLESVAAIGKAA